MRTRILKHIGLALLLALPLWGCLREPLVREGEAEGGKTVRLQLDLDIPDYAEASTKTPFADVPACNRIFVIVFDEADLLSEIVEATVSGSGFTVDLHPSALPRTLHFLGLPTSSPLVSILNDLGGSRIDEPNFASRLATADGDAACWARTILMPGISANTELGKISMVRNYAKVYIRNTEAQTHFRLESFRVYNASKYGMALPFKGTNLDNQDGFELEGLFPNFINAQGTMLSYADVNGTQGYRGYNHPSGQLRTPVAADADTYSSYLTSDGTDAVYDYIFETRYNPEKGNDNAFILFKGKFSGTNEFDSAPSTWYKADFVYVDPDSPNVQEWGPPDRIPYDILRNYAYVLTIEGVIGAGYAEPEDAATRPARNNFEGSVVGIDISGVSEGVNTLTSALYLSTTAIEIPRNANVDYIDLYYRNLVPANAPSASNDPHGGSQAVLITVSGDSIIDSALVNGSDGTLDTTVSGVYEEVLDSDVEELRNEGKYWGHLHLPLGNFHSSGSGTLQQTITIRNRKGLTRHCVISVRPLYPFEIQGYQQNPYIVSMEDPEAARGDSIRVNFRIPSGMPEALFPLEFKVESYADGYGPTGSTDVTRQILQPHSLAIATYKSELGPGDYRIELPVSGNSNTIVGENAADAADLTFNSYHFTRTLTWSEYCNATADGKFMKTFPVFMEPLFDPRSATDVANLGTTTVWMRQGERDATFFSYKDDANRCTRRLPFVFKVVEETEILLPPGDETHDGKPVYHVKMGEITSLTVQVVKADDHSVVAPNPLTITKGGNSPFSFSVSEGEGTITTNVSVSEVHPNVYYPVTARAETGQSGVHNYGASEAQFYIKTIKGDRLVSFPEADYNILRNQTLSSATNGTLQVNTRLGATASPALTSGTLVYSLDPNNVVTSNSYVEIVQTGSSYTLKGKAVNGATTVKVYAIALEDDNYERAVGEMNVHVKQGEIVRPDAWWASDTRAVGALTALSGNVAYDNLFSPQSIAINSLSEDDLWFETSDGSVASVEKIGGVWKIVPWSLNPSGESETVTLTMYIRCPDTDGNGVYGDAGDIFQATDPVTGTVSFTQTFTVVPGWWKVLNGTCLNGRVYAISDSGDVHLMGDEQMKSGGLFGSTRRYYLMADVGFSPTSTNGGMFFTSPSSYGFTFGQGNGRYSLRRGSYYLYPYGHEQIVIGWNETNDNDCLRLLTSDPSNRTKTCWSLSSDGISGFVFQAFTSNRLQNAYITYDSTSGYEAFDMKSSSSTNHIWLKCYSIDEVVDYAGYSRAYYTPDS